jgi:hypothetical protein
MIRVVAVVLCLLASACATNPPTQAQVQEAMDFVVANSELEPAPLPPVAVASSERITALTNPRVEGAIGVYLYDCRCIFVYPQWTMRLLVHEITHYLEHMAGRPPSHTLVRKMERAWALHWFN